MNNTKNGGSMSYGGMEGKSVRREVATDNHIVFIDSVSPKDAVFELKNERVLQQLEVEFQQLMVERGLDKVGVNEELLAMTRASNKSMKVHSGAQALEVYIELLISD